MLFNLFKSKKKDPKAELKKILKGYQLPTFPGVVMKVVDMLGDPSIDINEISAVIKTDPGMHIMILKTVNSAAFGLRREVTNINQAATLLGRSRLESMILPLGVKSSIPQIDMSCLDMKTFWLTSARKACLAGKIAEKIAPSKKLEAFTAGLLQDMAIPVLMSNMGDKYNNTFEAWHKGEKEDKLCKIEQNDLGFDHQEIAGLMALEWNLPEYLIDSIITHHGDNNLGVPCEIVSELRFINEDEDEELLVKEAYENLKKHLDLPDSSIKDLVTVAFENASEYAKIMY